MHRLTVPAQGGDGIGVGIGEVVGKPVGGYSVSRRIVHGGCLSQCRHSARVGAEYGFGRRFQQDGGGCGGEDVHFHQGALHL